MIRNLVLFMFVVSASFHFYGLSIAAEQTPAELARESENACVASARDKLTPEMIVEKVNEACELLNRECTAAFEKFRGSDSRFIFSGTYIWIHDMKGVMKIHPVKYKMEGKRLLNLKDINGKLFFVEMNKIAREQGSGWVDYVWPLPGGKKLYPKVSFVKLVKCNGEELVVGCGIYNMTKEDVEKALKKSK